MRLAIKRLILFAATFAITGCIPMCTEQHVPDEHWAQIRQEQELANAPKVRLTEKGELPAAGDGAVVVDAAKDYSMYCASCHGASGDGKGPGAAALNPSPRAFTDVAWQNQTDDERIAKVIKDGGTAVGLSATMAPWGAVMSDEQITAMVAYIRGMK